MYSPLLTQWANASVYNIYLKNIHGEVLNDDLFTVAFHWTLA